LADTFQKSTLVNKFFAMEFLFIYLVVCAISAGAAAKNGWNLWDSFFLALIVTPLVLLRKFFLKAD